MKTLFHYLSVLINFCSKIFYKFHKLSPYENPESNVDLAIKYEKSNPVFVPSAPGDSALNLVSIGSVAFD